MNAMEIKNSILFFIAAVIGTITFYLSATYFVDDRILLFYANALVVCAVWNMLRLLFRADLSSNG